MPLDIIFFHLFLDKLQVKNHYQCDIQRWIIIMFIVLWVLSEKKKYHRGVWCLQILHDIHYYPIRFPFKIELWNTLLHSLCRPKNIYSFHKKFMNENQAHNISFINFFFPSSFYVYIYIKKDFYNPLMWVVRGTTSIDG